MPPPVFRLGGVGVRPFANVLVLIGFILLNIFSTEEKGGFGSNLAYAIVAQGVGLLSSILTSLVLPKFLGVEDYAYWQLFLLYSS